LDVNHAYHEGAKTSSPLLGDILGDTTPAAERLPAENSFWRGFLCRPQRVEHRVDALETLFFIVSVHARGGLFVVVFGAFGAFGLTPGVLGFPSFLKVSNSLL